jgi:general secretion pathway protein G
MQFSNASISDELGAMYASDAPSFRARRSSLNVGRAFIHFRAFTLVEIMIVVVIIGLMAGLVTYATSGYLDRAKRQRARSDIATYSGAVDSYYLAKGGYPDNQTGLKALVPEFIKVLQNDPWGRPYQYVAPGKGGPYDIISYGADGRDGGAGADADITNWDVEVAEIKHK